VGTAFDEVIGELNIFETLKEVAKLVLTELKKRRVEKFRSLKQANLQAIHPSISLC
jgi:hypothetical protein